MSRDGAFFELSPVSVEVRPPSFLAGLSPRRALRGVKASPLSRYPFPVVLSMGLGPEDSDSLLLGTWCGMPREEVLSGHRCEGFPSPCPAFSGQGRERPPIAWPTQLRVAPGAVRSLGVVMVFQSLARRLPSLMLVRLLLNYDFFFFLYSIFFLLFKVDLASATPVS